LLKRAITSEPIQINFGGAVDQLRRDGRHRGI
jgi:hypothetical protein